MKRKDFCYIKIDETNNYIFSSGMEFKDFMNGISEKPKNLLILQGYPDSCKRSEKLFLDYIATEQIEDFIKEDVYGYGDFSWVDFKDTTCFEKISKQEIAEILYAGHFWEPMSKFTFNSLNNKYLYKAHDDDWIVKVYVADIKEYKKVIEYKILFELKGRKKYIAPIPDEILNKLYDLFKKGAVIDFEQSSDTSVTIYPIGNLKYVDDIHSKLDNYRNKEYSCLHINYITRKKTWEMRKKSK